jgi:hypothetical protein
VGVKNHDIGFGVVIGVLLIDTTVEDKTDILFAVSIMDRDAAL